MADGHPTAILDRRRRFDRSCGGAAGFLNLEGSLLEAVFVGLPAVLALTGVVAGTVGMLSK